MLSSLQVVDTGLSNGASAVGVCRADRFEPELETLLAHRSSGRSGPLHFTYEDPEVASDVARTFPWARSLVAVSIDYLPHARSPAPTGAVVGRFASSDHYRILDQPMTAIVELLVGAGGRAEVLVDDNRLLDRAVAIRSGIGWRGLSTMVLSPGRGPWTVLGTVVTDLELDESEPMKRGCGTCTACLPACPTSALDSSGLNATRCLSTWLQTGGSIPHWIRPHLGRRIYGCDDCLTSCPPGQPALRISSPLPNQLPFEELLRASDTELLTRFAWWYVPHRDPRIVRRNIVIAAGNSREVGVEEEILPYLDHRSGLLRGHSAWALATAAGERSAPYLVDRLELETDQTVRLELLLALQMVEDPQAHAEFLVHDEKARTGDPYPAGVSGKREPVTTAIRAIRNAGIDYEPFLFDYDRYPGAIGAAQALGIDPHLTVKTIVFEASDGQGVIALMNGDYEVSTKALARHLGVKTVKPATADRARRWTGYEFGGTSPFGTRETLRLVAHTEIPTIETIYLNAGSRGFLVAINPGDMIRVLEPAIVDLAVR